MDPLGMNQGARRDLPSPLKRPYWQPDNGRVTPECFASWKLKIEKDAKTYVLLLGGSK